ncbi:hypothetical protein [Mycolicibacterium fortuitum]|uniref:Uncharacterized protein n=1 Tax=Mycolicibacterium fortuitum TaxID=1766 RepID=A0AAE5AA20_MYCFO|nr:hypothetical protein [Mycolicibacterium fortuitum]MDV7194634.1 hypothetical protein [Mycolicibacterium fortuitum]MDV7208634.1 hypothetical protein [Mycolicibacterium fortuitum]MDV7230531.1 hypothetical protein [Mycolicibacterium fortuitum]MDV7261862.1 hypothetical protein [Mycolicibacterium fortuitum]MDV7287028.1 hypothetical protein [Mycolicibacterium fortuitum]
MDRAETVVYQALADNLMGRLNRGPQWNTIEQIMASLHDEARNILAALKAARIAIVELPEPFPSPRHQELVYEVGDSSVIVSEKWLNIRAELDYDNGDDDPLSVGEARAFASALLDAAARVEAFADDSAEVGR